MPLIVVGVNAAMIKLAFLSAFAFACTKSTFVTLATRPDNIATCTYRLSDTMMMITSLNSL